MLIKRARGWEIYEREATPESVFLSRRQLLAGGAAIAGATTVGPFVASAQFADPTFDLYPAKRNDAYKLDRDLTVEKFSADYNNFYEFGSSRASPRRHAR
jgi:sulfoxide reductase catalytic subunit YedY